MPANCFVLLHALWLCLNCSAAELEELKSKAAAIKVLAKYTEWRTNDFRSKDSRIVIGMIGSNPFKEGGPQLAEILTKKIGNHEVEVRVIRDMEEIEKCHMLFISLKERSYLKDVISRLKTLQDRRVLTISDIPEFNEEGGMAKISAVPDGIKTFKSRIEVNWDTLKSAGWTFDNQLVLALRN